MYDVMDACSVQAQKHPVVTFKSDFITLKSVEGLAALSVYLHILKVLYICFSYLVVYCCLFTTGPTWSMWQKTWHQPFSSFLPPLSFPSIRGWSVVIYLLDWVLKQMASVSFCPFIYLFIIPCFCVCVCVCVHVHACTYAHTYRFVCMLCVPTCMH